ncbi:MAG: hypothetical protein HA494_07745 [Thaumarchaeota archaeon]|nr:hypothetical protein [Nitrososphaerota archaeon]
MAERNPVFRREGVQRLLRALRDGVIEVLEPKLDAERGVSYPAAASVTGASDEELEYILRELSSLGVLSSSVVDNVAVCPSCGSPKLLLQIRCPTCGSPNLVRGVMIEHLACGHLDLEKSFRKEGGLTCPRCGRALKAIGVDYRRPGILYSCLNCRGSSSNPRRRYTCPSGHSFDEDDLVVREVNSYRLNPQKRELVMRETVDLKPTLEKFSSIWRLEAPATIRGRSGVELDFDYALWSKGSDGRVDVVAEVVTQEGEVNETLVLAFFAKTLDVEASERILVAMPKLDVKAKLLAKSYGIQVVEAESAQELQQKVGDLLRQIVVKREEASLKAEAETLEKVLEELEGNR